MKYTIKRQMATVFGLLMVGTILLCWFINNTFLETFYMRDKQGALVKAYQTMNQASNADTIETETFDITFQNICSKYNINYILLDAGTKTLKASTQDYSYYSERLLNNLFEREQSKGDKNLKKTDYYEIQIVTDQRTSTEFLEMWGVLDNGNLFLFRSPLESMRESVKLANRFLAYAGIGSAILSIIIVLFLSSKIVKPIKELTEISERMIRLDFDARYEGKGSMEIRRLGQNINELSSTLEGTISELKSANNELQKDIEKKTQIDEMRKEFLSNVSHELKTPIALIQGYAEGLKEGITDDEESKNFYCEVIMDEAGKMNKMVKKLLTLNQLEFGNEKVAMERFDITAMIRNYLQSAQLLCKQKEIRLLVADSEPIYVWADEFMVEEVFTNYFSNAMNHVAGERVINVKLQKKESVVRVSVFNTGDAIPEESLPHIWEKFYKVDKARTRAYGGSGVGLSIVKAVMEALHQQYGVANYDNGVEFWFELDIAGEA